jgi:predicted MFS family arabinose efflux permease
MPSAACDPGKPFVQLTALHNPQFRIYFAAAVASVNATWVFRVILSWEAWDMTKSPAFAGTIAAASLLPVALIGPFFGVLVDRGNVVRAYRLVNLGLLASAGAFLAFTTAGMMTEAVLLVLALCFGAVLAAYHPVRQSIAPRLVEGSDIPSVVALTALNFNLARLACPAIAGLLIAGLGVEAAALLSALLFLPAQVLAGRLSPRALEDRGEDTGIGAAFVAGVRAVASSPVRRMTILLAITALGPLRGLQELLSVIADGRFGRGVEGLGLLGSAVGAGALLAVLAQIFLPQRSTRTTRAGIALVVLAGFGSAQIVALTGQFPAALLAIALTAFSATFIAVEIQVALQTGLEDAVRGRVMSLWMLAVTLATSFCAWALGTLTGLVGLDRAVPLLHGASILLLGVALLRERAWRRRSAAIPERDPLRHE